MKFCDKCNNIMSDEFCDCQSFRCGNDDYKWRIIHEISFEAAAEKWAKQYDQDDHTLLNGDTAICEVINSAGVVKKFKVNGHIEHVYEASELT